MSQRRDRIDLAVFAAVLLLVTVIVITRRSTPVRAESTKSNPVIENAAQKIGQGQQTFRFDTFGDEDFWGGTLKLHHAIEGAALGGVGPGLTPSSALANGPQSRCRCAAFKRAPADQRWYGQS